MRLVGVSMVRNEADIIEAFVRHNAAVLDALVVVDHGSVDGTREILFALRDEGLPLAIEQDHVRLGRQELTLPLSELAASFVLWPPAGRHAIAILARQRNYVRPISRG